MFHRKLTRIAVITGLAVAMVGALTISLLTLHAGVAHATPPTSVTITNYPVFTAPPPAPFHGTFTATAPLCSSGTFIAEWQEVTGAPYQTSPAQFTGLVRSTLTCDDGSGTFIIQEQTHFPLQRFDGVPWKILSGTGTYATLHGGGSHSSGGGIDTLTGDVHFD